MKTTNVKTAKNKLSEILRDAQLEQVVIMNHGRPVAIVLGVEGHPKPKVDQMVSERSQEIGVVVHQMNAVAQKAPPASATNPKKRQSSATFLGAGYRVRTDDIQLGNALRGDRAG